MATPQPRQVDVTGVGLNATDTIIRLPCFPAPDSKMEYLSAEIHAGGQVASALVACQYWGLQTRYVGKVGGDSAADFQRKQLEAAGVEAHLLTVPGCASQNAFILVDQQTGERTILWSRPAALTLQPEEIQKEWVVNTRALLVDGHDTAAAAAAAAWAREAGIPVVADVDNLYPGIEKLLTTVDYLVASRDFPSRLTGETEIFAALRSIREKHHCRVVGATLGRHGAIAWDGGRLYYAAGFQVEAMDTTGAGDIFHGAFVYGLLRAWPLQQILEFSCAAAALNCTAIGARGGIRPIAEIEALMRSGRRGDPPPEVLRAMAETQRVPGDPA